MLEKLIAITALSPMLCQSSPFVRSLRRWQPPAIHVVPDDSFEDWVVRDDNGDEFGHYATREAAELVAQAIARKCGNELVVHLPDGRMSRKSFANGWAARLLWR